MRSKVVVFLSFFLASIGILNASSFVYAQHSCTDAFSLQGVSSGLLWQSYVYQFEAEGIDLPGDAKVIFSLDGKKLSDTGISIQHSFEHTGSYMLTAELKSSICTARLEYSIQIYEKQILYLWDEADFLNFGFEEQLNKAWYLFTPIFTKKTEFTDNQDNLAFTLADIIIINEKKFWSYLEKYIAIKKASSLPLAKDIILITDANQNLLKRSLAQYAQSLENDKIIIVDPLHFMNLLWDISLEKSYMEQSYITSFDRSIESHSRWMLISYVIDELLKSGFPMQILGILLSLSVVALMISFLRQVVGLSVFGVYWPLFFALIMHLIGIKVSLILLALALVTTILMSLLNRRIYLLHSSKVSLSLVSFLIVLLLGYGVLRQFDVEFFTGRPIEILIVFPIILMLLISEKIFPSFKIWQKSWWIGSLELLILTTLAYALLEWNWLSTTLLSYPELLIFIFIVNIILGRFSGLQLLELIRFMPLIKKNLDQEEE